MIFRPGKDWSRACASAARIRLGTARPFNGGCGRFGQKCLLRRNEFSAASSQLPKTSWIVKRFMGGKVFRAGARLPPGAGGNNAGPRFPAPREYRDIAGRPPPRSGCRGRQHIYRQWKRAARPGCSTTDKPIRYLPRPKPFITSNASFSQLMSTSPMPRWAKVMVALRAPSSRTGALRKAPTNCRGRVGGPVVLAQGVALGGEISPARAAGRFWIGGDDSQVRAGPDRPNP